MKYISAVILLAISFNIYLAELTPIDNKVDIINSINKKAISIKTISCYFQSDKHYSDEKSQSSGDFYFKSKKQIRWKYTKPSKHDFIINGNKISIKDDSNFDEYEMKYDPIFVLTNKLILSYYDGKIFNSEKYLITFSDKKTHYTFILIPKSNKTSDIIQSIKLDFNKIDSGLIGIKLEQNSKEYTSINFGLRIVNSKLDKDIFKF